MIIEEGKYYLYRHIRPDKNEVFYIGIGVKPQKSENIRRIDGYDRAYCKLSRTKHWKNIANLNPNYEIEILLESDDYEFIKEKEKEFIRLYGRNDLGLGTLCNFTDGGQGTIGRKYITSEETKRKLSEFNKGKTVSEESKLKISKAHKGRISPMKGRKQTQKFIDAIKKANTGRKRTEEQKSRYSNAKKGKSLPEDVYKWRYKKIIQFDIDDNIIKEWDNIRDASKEYGVGSSEISVTCKANAGMYPVGHKSYNRKTCRGYIWKYKQN